MPSVENHEKSLAAQDSFPSPYTVLFVSYNLFSCSLFFTVEMRNIDCTIVKSLPMPFSYLDREKFETL